MMNALLHKCIMVDDDKLSTHSDPYQFTSFLPWRQWTTLRCHALANLDRKTLFVQVVHSLASYSVLSKLVGMPQTVMEAHSSKERATGSWNKVA